MPSSPSSSVLGGDTKLHQVGKIFIEMAGIQNCVLAPMPKGKMSTVVLQGRSCGLPLFAWRTSSWERKPRNGKSRTHWDLWELTFTGGKALGWAPPQIIFNTQSTQNGVNINHFNFYRRKLRWAEFESFSQGHILNDRGAWTWTQAWLAPRQSVFLIYCPNFHLVGTCSVIGILHIISLNPCPIQ